MRCFWTLLALLATTSTLGALDYRPWYDRDKRIDVKPWGMYQYSPSVDTGSGIIHRKSNNAFAGITTSFATDNLSMQNEVICSRTNQRSFSFESFATSARMQLTNDCVGDPFAIVVGVTAIAPSKHALRDYNVIYHGTFESELHIAIGKEQACRAYWDTRSWGVLAFGVANRGHGWMRGRAAYEINACDQHQWSFFADGACGFGREKLFLDVPFKGYGSIEYRTVDLGGCYTWMIDDCGTTVSAAYSMRVFGKNTTRLNQNIMIQLLLPFHI